MEKRFKQILAILLAVCFIISEWGCYGFSVNAAENGLTISGASTISTIQKGSAWTCKGTISSNNIIKEVKGTIYESDGLTVIYRKSVYPNSNSYTIQNGEIDKALLFNKLQAGTYFYVIDATDASRVKKTLINNKFTVQGSGGSSLKITGASTISSLKQGKSWTCSGTVSSNYVLKEVRGTIYEGDGIKVKYQKSVYPNNKSYKIQNGEIDRALLFNNLSSGTYYYTIVASDVSGRTLTLVRNKFAVQGQSVAASTLKITGASTISSLQQGSPWTCKGTVSSNYALKEVRGTIYESDGITVKYRKSVYPNGKSYSIQNGEIDKALLFNSLPAGTYHYTIVAKDASGEKEKTLVNNKFTVQAKAKAASTLKITGASTISSLKQGNSWSCKGTVSSNYTLQEVRGTIYESDGITVKYRKSVYPAEKSYKIQNGEIDRSLLFNSLPAGTYHYTIVAKDTSGEKEKTLVNNKFTVQAVTSTLKITGASKISSLKQGQSWSCKGTVSSNYVLKEVRGTIYESDGIKVKYRKSVYPNSKSYKIQNGEIDKELLFNNLSAGTYHYTIVAWDASGIEKTLINNKFTVQAKANAASKLKITGASKISSLQQGKSWSCKGTVSSNYVLKEVRGTIYESNGVTVKYRKSVYPNSKSYKIQNGEIDKELLFNNLPAGTYHYTIVARDASGEKEKTLVNNRFEVKKPKKIYSSPLKVKTKFTTNFKENGHRGVDLAAPEGTAIYALAAGKVLYSQFDSSYGNFIVIKHTDGMYSLYAHMRVKSNFKAGSTVKKGAKIGEVGNTGYSFGAHLHLELATGQVPNHYLSDANLTYLVDPKQYINF